MNSLYINTDCFLLPYNSSSNLQLQQSEKTPSGEISIGNDEHDSAEEEEEEENEEEEDTTKKTKKKRKGN